MVDKATETPSVFISYSHDSPVHKLWVANLASRLLKDGINVYLDQWDLRLGDSIVSFAEKGISAATYVLLICSDTYSKKAEKSIGGVGYEKTIISSELIKKTDRIKYVPIIRNNPKKILPSFLSDRLYLDFTLDTEFHEKYEILLRQLYASIKHNEPPVGSKIIGSRPDKKPSNKKISVKGEKNVFISYSHADKKWLKELQIMLSPLIRLERIALWDDTKISAGDEWRKEIDKGLKETKVAVLLVTPNFLASDFIAENELPPLLDRKLSNGIQILWVAVSSSFYVATEIAKYQAANNPSRPLDILAKPQRNKEWVSVCEQILSAFEK